MSPGFRVACEWLGGGSGWLFSAIPHSALRNPHSPQGVSHKHPEYNSPPAPTSGWSGGTLDKPWTCPGTIEHLQTPVFDQLSLSRPLSCGISAAERFGCGADLWSGGPRKLRLCGPCSAKPDLWAALPSRSGFCILPSTFAWGWLWVASGGWARLLIFVGGEFCIQPSQKRIVAGGDSRGDPAGPATDIGTEAGKGATPFRLRILRPPGH